MAAISHPKPENGDEKQFDLLPAMFIFYKVLIMTSLYVV